MINNTHFCSFKSKEEAEAFKELLELANKKVKNVEITHYWRVSFEMAHPFTDRIAL